jgi:glycosyltransferase involved in cell wall biosynthesis
VREAGTSVREELIVRVLYVENSYGEMGGSLMSLLQLTRALAGRSSSDRRIEPCFLFLYPNLLVDEFRAAGPVALLREDYAGFGRAVALPRAVDAALARLPHPIRRGLGEILPLARAVAREVRRLDADLVHANCRLGSNEYAILGALLARVPVVVHERLIYPVSPLTRPFAAAADVVIAISHAVAGSLARQGVRARRVEVVHNGIPLEELARFARRGRDPGAPLRVGMAGRVTRWKGQHVLVEAARRVAEKIPDARFHVAGESPPGDGAYQAALRETIADLDLERRFVFHGNVKDVYAFMADMDLMVHCSVDPEPLGRVIQEAMALGKPVIAARGGAVEEICTADHDALVIEPGRPDLLASAIERLARDPALASRLGANARATMESRFDISRAAERISALYAETLARPARRPMREAISEFLASNPLSRSRARARSRP